MSIFRRSSKGQIAIITILAMPCLLAALALGTDMAVMYSTWASLQKAADAAVLAGGGSLPVNTAQATADCRSYLDRNGVSSGSEIYAGPTISQTAIANDTISVTVQRTMPHLFGRMVGLFSAPIRVTATAWAQPAGSVGDGVVPVGVNDQTTMDWGTTINIYGDGNTFPDTPSHWGGLNLPGLTGASGFEDAIRNGYNGSVGMGDVDPLETGLKNGPVKAAFQSRIDDGVANYDPQCGGSCTWDNHPPGDPRDMVVPLVSGTPAPGGGSSVTITGFVHVWLVDVAGNGNGKGNPLHIVAQLMKGAVAADLGHSAPGPAASPIFRVVLIK